MGVEPTRVPGSPEGWAKGIYPPPAALTGFPGEVFARLRGWSLAYSRPALSKVPDGCKGTWTNRVASLPRKG